MNEKVKLKKETRKLSFFSLNQKEYQSLLVLILERLSYLLVFGFLFALESNLGKYIFYNCLSF